MRKHAVLWTIGLLTAFATLEAAVVWHALREAKDNGKLALFERELAEESAEARRHLFLMDLEELSHRKANKHRTPSQANKL